MRLPSLTVVADEVPKLRPFKAVIADELNVREVILTEQAAASEGGFGVRQVVQVQRAGRLGRGWAERPDGDQGQQVRALVGQPGRRRPLRWNRPACRGVRPADGRGGNPADRRAVVHGRRAPSDALCH